MRVTVAEFLAKFDGIPRDYEVITPSVDADGWPCADVIEDIEVHDDDRQVAIY